MFCQNCGRELREGAKFCEHCGAGQQAPAPKKKKKSHKGLIAAIAVVLVLAVAAALVLPMLLSGTETVYVLTNITKTNSDGEETEWEYGFDENGNVTAWYSFLPSYYYEAEYDEHGNIVEKVETRHYTSENMETSMVYEYDHDYDGDGILESTKVTYDGLDYEEWEYSWDEDGNLTRADCTAFPADMQMGHNLWAGFVYDGEGRLTEEYWCRCVNQITSDSGEVMYLYLVYHYEYTYDRAGNLKEFLVEVSKELEEADDIVLEQLDYSEFFSYEYGYDADSNLVSVEGYNGLTGRDVEMEFSYDSDGNIELDDDSEYTFDEQGNLLTEESDSGAMTEYEYEEVELSRGAARRYRRWVSLYALDPVKLNIYPMSGVHIGTNAFFYYLIPNPIW